ncbi:LacI family gluconate utilization system Gnt-I transcriptional repressor [Peteryoungia aggregata LMG 23059]|uniref:LacI family gluconate utilization system Gnt-I transcriptional repressor n=1 Tax=Peteryoungia aggregata LMG 23059 TaxID=1368425 RepID=A0ABU0GBW7_9HYPH|nr:LacI family DNA-binding transcriptional regulator [Peteryoungia aggregata]MDQ0422846.1 LacI family gluconate utilization system Gnt-I transcriptional repressor [Peteryoungia aggregata LMG 23059]
MSQVPHFPRTITIADVAKAAGVSSMTVSKVLRGTGRIATETRARVTQIAEELGYVPNRLAGALSSQTSSLIGIVIPSIGDQVYAGVLAGINEVLNAEGYTAFIGESFFDPESELRIVHMMLTMKPAALILTGGLARDERTAQLLRRSGIRAIHLWDGDHPDLDATVGLSHLRAGWLAAQVFIEAGLTGCAYVGSQLDRDLCAACRLEGYSVALSGAGATLQKLTDSSLPRTAETGYVLTRKLIEQGEMPQAIHYLNDAMAIGGLRFMIEAGIAVPDTISVNGFNGTALPHSLTTRLTTIEVPLMEIGRRAAKAALATSPPDAQRPVDLIDICLTMGTTVAGRSS